MTIRQENQAAIELLDEWFDEEPVEETPEPMPLNFGAPAQTP